MPSELNGDEVDPVEGHVTGQIVEYAAGAIADDRLVVGEVGRGRYWRYRLALLDVARRVHADEARALLALRLILNLYASEL